MYYAAQHLSVSSMTDEEPSHLVPLLLTGVVQGGVAILVLGVQSKSYFSCSGYAICILCNQVLIYLS